MSHASRATIKNTRASVRKKAAARKRREDGFMRRNLMWLDNYEFGRFVPRFIKALSLKRVVLGALMLFFLLWSVAVIKAGQWHTKSWDMLTQSVVDWTVQRGFVVQDILIEGRVNIDRTWLQSQLNYLQDQPILSVDVTALHQELVKNPWVKDVMVQRVLPDHIKIILDEREPFVLKPYAGTLAKQKDANSRNSFILIDKDAHQIGVVTKDDFADLQIVSGAEAEKKASQLIPLLRAEPSLLPLVRQSIYVGQRRWNLELYNGVVIKLPEKDVGFALRRLMQKNEDYPMLDKDIRAIDLRDDTRILLEMHKGKPQTIAH